MDKQEKPSGKKRNLRLVDRYDNDDYSRFAAPDYNEHPFEVGAEDDSGSSGPSQVWSSGMRGGEPSERRTHNFYGRGPKGYRRSDERIYEDACEMLMRHRDIDASEIAVNVDQGVVTLSGKVQSRRMRHLAELVLEHISGVADIVNELTIFPGSNPGGPQAVKRKDLGLT